MGGGATCSIAAEGGTTKFPSSSLELFPQLGLGRPTCPQKHTASTLEVCNSQQNTELGVATPPKTLLGWWSCGLLFDLTSMSSLQTAVEIWLLNKGSMNSRSGSEVLIYPQ